MERRKGNKFMIGAACACILLICALILSMISYKMLCPIQEQETGTIESEKLIVVGYSQIGSESVWRTTNSVSVQQAFTKENGYFLIFNNARQKQENQIKAIRSYISQRVDYIVFTPITEDGWDTVLQEAKDAGIPVIIADRMAAVRDESLFTAWVGSDVHKEGRNAGLWLEQHLEAEGRAEEEVNIVVLKGTEGSTAQIGRSEGFEEIASKNNNWNILDQKSGDFTTAKAQEVMRGMIEKNNTIDVVVSQNDDMTLGAIKALNDAGLTAGVDGDVILISFDAVREALELVQEGIINVDVECNPLQGECIEAVIQSLIRGEEVKKYNYVDEEVFTQDNVSEVLPGRIY